MNTVWLTHLRRPHPLGGGKGHRFPVEVIVGGVTRRKFTSVAYVEGGLPGFGVDVVCKGWVDCLQTDAIQGQYSSELLLCTFLLWVTEWLSERPIPNMEHPQPRVLVR
jgi:hypothetical protein